MNPLYNRQSTVDLMDLEFTTAPLYLPDAASATENAMTAALDFAANRLGTRSQQAVIRQLQQGEPLAYQYVNYGLACQMAQILGAMDRSVKAVYMFDDYATSEDAFIDQQTPVVAVHLITWVERKTQALVMLAQALDQSLVSAYAHLVGAEQLAHVLDVQVVDDTEVRHRIGYAALITSLHHQPIQVWQR